MPTSADLREALSGPVLEVAPRLLGATLRRGQVVVRLTEVEAYDGADDPGSHAYRGRTPRNEVMFGPAGRLYVYFTYGMHHCCNVVTGEPGRASAVLLRAGEVLEGEDVAGDRRSGARARDLARGPARLCQALGLTREDNGSDLSRGPLLTLPPAPPRAYETGPRVGLRAAADRPWRMWLPGEPTVSSYRPAAPLRRRGGPGLGTPRTRC